MNNLEALLKDYRQVKEAMYIKKGICNPSVAAHHAVANMVSEMRSVSDKVSYLLSEIDYLKSLKFSDGKFVN